MAQNNSLFVWKTSNYGRGRLNLRTDMNQVTNLKSLGFTRGRIADLLGVFLRFFYATETFVVSLMLVLIPIFVQSSVLW